MIDETYETLLLLLYCHGNLRSFRSLTAAAFSELTSNASQMKPAAYRMLKCSIDSSVTGGNKRCRHGCLLVSEARSSVQSRSRESNAYLYAPLIQS